MQRLKRDNHVDQLALTPSAASTLKSIPQDLLVNQASELLRSYWQPGGVVMIVGAIGAVTRLIAPLLIDKQRDPAILVLDAKANYVVPVLGGHQAGAEQLALELAAALGSDPILTSNCSSQERLAIDSFGFAWGWQRSGSDDAWHQLMLSQARGEILNVEQHAGSLLWQTATASTTSLKTNITSPDAAIAKLSIGPKISAPYGWHPASLWLGVGCERNTSRSLLDRGIATALRDANLAQEAVAGLASIDLKADEPALLELAKANNWPLRFFSAERLNDVTVPTPSAVVKAEIGTASVAEAAALLAAGNGGALLHNKQIHQAQSNECGAATIAIAESLQPFAPQRGELHLIGSGPGDLALLTQDVRSALARCSAWVGYSLYLDLLEPLRRSDQARLDGKLTKEKERCQQAMDLAQAGARVALISSGDSGIYGMAGLALELWLDMPSMERPAFEVHPGISALQLAAARVGAPLMHDFCTVSLSDRLTPWPTIEKRLEGAARGDFVVALYNPRSQGRDWQLQQAIELFLNYRPSSTPVVLARQLGRTGENITLHTLKTLPIEEVDMLTLVLIGNMSSRCQDGAMVTPRGYPGAELN
ncbi:MAG: precorrin-3B C(17)-methyltransferase [Prochlorococcus sp.]|nr:precorrin-3B C(17)-methyltransferase [Prochlorococcaceae cyanobacterium ETNP18_MAG_1]